MSKKRSKSGDNKKKKKVKIEDFEVKNGQVSDNDEYNEENKDNEYNEYNEDQMEENNEFYDDKKDPIFIGDEKINPEELDEHGNIKNLFDYEDKDDYEEYKKEMSRREKLENSQKKKKIKTNVIFPILLESFGCGKPSQKSEEKNLLKRIMDSGLSDKNKVMVVNKLKNTDMDKPKQVEWIESLLEIPFGVHAKIPITISEPKDKIKDFFMQAYESFNNKVYGLQNVKDEIVNYLAQYITAGTSTNLRVLALYGNPGVGKTYIVRSSLATVLNRHLCCINMGGIRDAAHFYGFSYTYSGSKCGVIAQQLMDAKIMNPIICFEEVDKISDTKEGYEIQNVLMHLTDPEQNHAFQDKYFSGIDIDLSKAVIVMTLNNPELLDPILLNRLHLIKVPDPTVEDKLSIIKDHIYPRLCQNIGFDKSALNIKDEIYKYIISKYNENDKGMRTLKKHLETIILKLNTIKLIGCDLSGKFNLNFPLDLTQDIIDKILDTNEEKEQSVYYQMYM